MIIASIYLFILALLLALIEIEIEGKFGWAEKIPTWYKKTGISKAFYLLNGKKPLTGYHLFMLSFLFLIFHLVFFLGLIWTLQKELFILAIFFILSCNWDFLWFVLNPYYTIKNYRKDKIWWFSQSKWVFNIFPIDYVCAFIIASILIITTALYSNNYLIVIDYLTLLITLLALTIITILLSPIYHRWYKEMRKKDERNLIRIFH